MLWDFRGEDSSGAKDAICFLLVCLEELELLERASGPVGGVPVGYAGGGTSHGEEDVPNW